MDEQSLNELLECSVCLERLDHSSKVLPCQHTFCRRCLEEIVSTKRELRCPECRTLVEVRVDDLPPNILLVRLLEGIKTRQTVEGSRSGRHGEVSSGGGRQSRSGSQACAKALYCYEAKDQGDLSFKKGDIITLRKQVDENWYHGELNGQHGFFPASYVQVLIPLPVHIPQCKALYDFDLKDENEKDCLTFKKDEVLTVIKRVDDNWVEGKKGEKIGIFPISFVEMNEAAKMLINSKINIPQHAALSDATAGRGSGDLMLAPPNTQLLGTGLASQLPQQKRHSFTASSQRSNQPSQSNQYHRRSLELSSSGNLVIASTSSDVTRIPPPPVPAVSSRSESQTIMASADSVRGAVASDSKKVTNVVNNEHVASSSNKVVNHDSGKLVNHDTSKSVNHEVSKSGSNDGGKSGLGVTSPVYVALYNYKPAKDDEVELRKGDYYTVSNKCQDGWFKGRCLKSGEVGVFPGNYVQLVRAHSAFRPVSGNSSNLRNQSHSNATVPPTSASVVPKSEPSSLPVTSSAGTATNSAGSDHQLVTSSSRSNKHQTRRRSLSPSRPNTSPSRPTKSPASRTSMSPHRSSSSVSQLAPPINPRGSKLSSASMSSSHSPSSSITHTSSKQASHSSATHSVSSGNDGLRSSSLSGATVYVPQHISHKSGNINSVTAQGQSRHAANLSAMHMKHSMSASANITPPNVVVGAAGETPTTVPNITKEKREKKDKEKISLVKRLVTSGKSKKSKSPASDADGTTSSSSHITDSPLVDLSITHVRSGSCPTDITNAHVIGAEGNQHVKTGSFDSSTPLQPHSQKPSRPKPLLREKFRCVVPYPPQSEIELELKVGDLVYVHKKREDGWFKGTLQRTGKTGLFPGSFVEKLD